MGQAADPQPVLAGGGLSSIIVPVCLACKRSKAVNNNITTALTKFWHWLTNRSLEVEHIGMAAVILISTWHVSQHMRGVEGSTVVAVVMGAVLGFLNAVFAMRFFEERQETRWPAGVGVIFFAAVSVWMQYGFYDANSDLQPYSWGNVNLNALAFGAWAPISEILLGWLYGVRLFARGAQNKIVDTIKAQYERLRAELQAKVDSQLTVNQQLRDELYAVKTNNQQRDDLIASRDALIVQLRSEVADLRVRSAVSEAKLSTVKAAPVVPVNDSQLAGRLTAAERKNKILEILQIQGEATRAGLARDVGAAVNTIKADLRELEAEQVISVNGMVRLCK